MPGDDVQSLSGGIFKVRLDKHLHEMTQTQM